jgi:hypothetical protein
VAQAQVLALALEWVQEQAQVPEQISVRVQEQAPGLASALV